MQTNADAKDFNGFRAPKGDIPSDISGDDFTEVRMLMAGKNRKRQINSNT